MSVENHFPAGAAVVGQSGGPTAAINATLAGVIRACLAVDSRASVTKLYGMRHGIDGLLEQNLVDLSARFLKEDGTADDAALLSLSRTPAAALGSCRMRLPDPEKDSAPFATILDTLKQYGIRWFFYIGGNDSMDTVEKLSRYAASVDYPLRVVGLPKTIDNDLLGTDHSPGYGSAAKFVATAVREIALDCAVYAVPAVTIVEIMGRHAGWLTAAAALPRLVGGAGPDLVYLPETPFDMERFFADLRKVFERKQFVVVAVSEGVRFPDGGYVGAAAQSGVKDVFAHQYLAGVGRVLERRVREKFGCKVRAVELSLTQRCSVHCASLTDLTESEAVGSAGVAAALSGATGCMMSIERVPGPGYAVRYVPADVRSIANGEKLVPTEYLTNDGRGVTDDCLRYLLPLISGEPTVPTTLGIPDCFVID